MQKKKQRVETKARAGRQRGSIPLKTDVGENAVSLIVPETPERDDGKGGAFLSQQEGRQEV